MSASSSDTSKQLLSGAELVQLRKKAGRSLPVKNSKEFRPSGSWLERKQIQSSLDEAKALIEEQRVEKQGSLAKAEWSSQFRVAQVTCRTGAQWNTMGHEKRGKLLLFPEEALFLLEMNKLQVFFDGVPMSIQQAYTVLLGSFNGCTLNEYRTYAHLVKQGYILLRHSKNLHITCYEQKIRLHQYTLSQKQCKAKQKNVADVSVNYDKDGGNNKGDVNKNVEVVDVEYLPSKTQSTNKRESNTIAEQRLQRAENLWQSKLLTSQNKDESMKVEKSDYVKPSTKNICSQSSDVIAQKEQSVCKTGFQSTVEIIPVREEENDDIKKEKLNLPGNVKTANCAKFKASEVTATVQSHINSSDIIILDEDVEPLVTNRSRQISESSSSEADSIKCETPHFKASNKRMLDDSDVEVEASVDRKPAVSDLDSECEVLEINRNTKKQKYSPRQETSKNIIQRLVDTPEMKSETKFDMANFHSNGRDWMHPSSSNVGAKNIGKHRITNVQLSDTEIEIVPGVIDKAQENKVVKQESKNDIEVIELEDDEGEVKMPLSKKEEKMRILDSLPSVEGKFLIHVKAPSADLLPPNVTPQKKDYYIQLWRLNAAGIGGRPRSAENNEQNNNRRREFDSQSESRINPWISRPPEQNRGYRQAENTWGVNVQPGTNFFVNQNYGASPFNMFQTMWQQFTNFFTFMNNPVWNVNSFGMQLPWVQPQINMWRPPWQNRGRPPWRRPYNRRGRGRFRPEYRRYPMRDNVSSDAEAETRVVEANENTRIIPLSVEGTKTERINNSENKLDKVEVKSSNYNDSEESKELVILDDDNDDDPVAILPLASQHIKCTEMRNRQKQRKRGGSSSNRYFQPPKKLRGLMEQLLSETKAEQKVKRDDDDEKEEEEEENAHNADADESAAKRKSLKLGDMRNWKDLKDTVSHVMQEIILDSASSEEECEEEIDVTASPEPDENRINPLVQPEDCFSMDTILSKLQIISSINVQEDDFSASEKLHKISFDVYLPNTPFRKASPGLPKYRIAVLGFQDHIPSLGELAMMMRQLQDDVPLIFAIVIPDSVTFFQLGSVNLPVEVTFPDII